MEPGLIKLVCQYSASLSQLQWKDIQQALAPADSVSRQQQDDYDIVSAEPTSSKEITRICNLGNGAHRTSSVSSAAVAHEATKVECIASGSRVTCCGASTFTTSLSQVEFSDWVALFERSSFLVLAILEASKSAPESTTFVVLWACVGQLEGELACIALHTNWFQGSQGSVVVSCFTSSAEGCVSKVASLTHDLRRLCSNVYEVCTHSASAATDNALVVVWSSDTIIRGRDLAPSPIVMSVHLLRSILADWDPQATADQSDTSESKVGHVVSPIPPSHIRRSAPHSEAPATGVSLEAGEQPLSVRRDRLPTHVAIIMDGNGRWATNRGLPRTEGHREGVERVCRI